jgi:flagellar hook-associated protein 1 FlgK
MIGPQSFWSADADERLVGTIRITSPSGYDTDLIADKAIRSGSIKAHLEMRDQTLVQAQAQLDEIAHALASALSDRTVPGTAAVSGAQSGFSVDLTELRNGNSISLNYLDGAGQQQRMTIVRVDDASALPLSNDFTSDPNDTVVGVSFANGMAGAVNALNNALGTTGIVFDNPSGYNLRVLDDGGVNPGTVQALSAKVTTATFDSGNLSMPFFVDAGLGSLYTNAVTAAGQQKVGFAARIAVNPTLKANPSYLVQYGAGVAAGDPARAEFIEQQLSAVSMTFSPSTGIGTASGPYNGSLSDFIRQAVSMQGAAAENATRLNDGQEVVLNALQARFAERSSVNVDSEMANLLVLQTAYGANARVLSAVKEMIDALMRI